MTVRRPLMSRPRAKGREEKRSREKKRKEREEKDHNEAQANKTTETGKGRQVSDSFLPSCCVPPPSSIHAIITPATSVATKIETS